jgi:glycosyltransferase involved in cell wall biosynthesis
MIVMSHPTGNANVRAVIAALDEARLLKVFHTTVGLRADALLPRALPQKVRRTIARRSFAARHARIEFHPWTELRRLAGHAHIDEVCFALDAQVAACCRKCPDRISAVYCYEDIARDTFRVARERNWTTFYELPIAYWETSRRLLAEEAERWPAWEPTLVGTRDSREKLARKKEELELADVVLCPSQFVLDSLPQEAREAKTCVVAEFGSPPVSLRVLEQRARDTAPLRVLFAGSMTQRKGLADLFAAIKLVRRKDIEFVVMGAPVAPHEFYRKQLADFRHEPPRPHSEVLQLMQSCDVFALPSIVEGRALVQQEALACGLPIIVTANAGGEDLVEEGETGFLVPIRSPDAIAEKLRWFADHREELPRMREAARAKAAEYTWQRYGEKVVNAVRSALEPEEVAA